MTATPNTHNPPVEVRAEADADTEADAGPRTRLRALRQDDAFTSPWALRTRLKVGLWALTKALLFHPTPKPLSPWRVFLLRLFGCRVNGTPYVAPSAVIKMPWNLVLEDRACLAPGSEVYNLATVTLKRRATVAQQVYLCAGTHDLSDPNLPLVVGEIVIGEDAFLGVRALVLPGVTVGDGAVIGAGAVVTRDMPAWTVCAGNPCKPLKRREWKGDAAATEAVGVATPATRTG